LAKSGSLALPSASAVGLEMKNGTRVWVVRKAEFGAVSLMATSVGLLTVIESTTGLSATSR